MSERITYLTREGKAKLEAELKTLETEGRAEVAKRIEEAKELGDVSESGEYEDAKKASGFLEGRIKEIRAQLANHQIIEDEPVGDAREVRIGSTVTIRYEGEDDDEEYRIVGSAESNPSNGYISNESPLGSALIGHRVRTKVVVQGPQGPFKVTIRSIK
jgi:transcription elongation factor GreA